MTPPPTTTTTISVDRPSTTAPRRRRRPGAGGARGEACPPATARSPWSRPSARWSTAKVLTAAAAAAAVWESRGRRRAAADVVATRRRCRRCLRRPRCSRDVTGQVRQVDRAVAAAAAAATDLSRQWQDPTLYGDLSHLHHTTTCNIRGNVSNNKTLLGWYYNFVKCTGDFTVRRYMRGICHGPVSVRLCHCPCTYLYTCNPDIFVRHGTGSLGHRVSGSFGSSFTAGSPGHHFDPVWDLSLSGFRKNAQNAKRTFEMLKWQKSLSCAGYKYSYLLTHLVEYSSTR